jgi:DNA helicase HerA-like ATPase
VRRLRAPPRLLERLQNLGALEWDIWSWDRPPAQDVIAARPAATVLDLGSLQRTEEQLAVSLAVLDDLWAQREQRRPLLVVVDEAHTLCSPDLDTPLGMALVDRLVQIAAEGRKYGLWLLLSTQRPSRVHRSVVSQCDNLALMRMNSPVDLAELSEIFGFAPPGMLSRSPHFRQGEALVAGGFVAAPSIMRVGPRLTEQGGVDVPVPMVDA